VLIIEEMAGNQIKPNQRIVSLAEVKLFRKIKITQPNSDIEFGNGIIGGNASRLFLPSIKLLRVLPVWMKLSHVLLFDKVVIFFGDIMAIFVVVDTFSAVAFNHIFAEQSHRLVSYLTFTSSLFGSQQILHGVLGPADLLKQSREAAEEMGRE
jgi:hypothetical protein